MRVVVTRAVPEAALSLLRPFDLWVSPHDRALARAELLSCVADASAIVTMLHDRVDEEFLEAAGPSLELVANVAVGYDNIEVAACRSAGVVVTNTPGVLVDATADLALGLMLMITRRLGEGERLIRSRRPWAWAPDFMLGTGLQGKTLGIVGMGAIGSAVAERARAFGMEVVASSRSSGVPLASLLEAADVVSLHCPLTSATRHLIDAAALSSMKPSAVLINTARGPVVDEAALVQALRDRVIAGAALDVFEDEPRVHPGLLDLDNVVLVPHLGSATIETRTAMAVLAARNVAAVLGGEPPLTPV